MASCKTAVSPLLTHWRYCSFALSHSYRHTRIYFHSFTMIYPWSLVVGDYFIHTSTRLLLAVFNLHSYTTLTHWELTLVVNLQTAFWKAFYGKFIQMLLRVNQQYLSTGSVNGSVLIRRQFITWNDFDIDFCCHTRMAPLATVIQQLNEPDGSPSWAHF